MLCFFFSRYVDHRDLHVLTHSFPTRRSSDLIAALARAGVAHVALGEFGFDEFIAGAFDDFFVETLFEFGVEFGIAVEIARLEKRGADGEILARKADAIGEDRKSTRLNSSH